MKKLFVTAILLVFATAAKAEPRVCTPDAANLLADLNACKPQPKKKAPGKKAKKPASKAEDPKTCPTCNVTVNVPEPKVYQLDPVIINVMPETKVIVIQQTTVAPEAKLPVNNHVLPKKPKPDFGYYRKLRIGVGVMGFGYGFKDLDVYAAWGWGPMFQLQLFPTQNLEVTLALGIGLGLEKVTSSPGHMRGWMAEVGGTYWLTKHFGLALSARGDLIDTKGETVYVVGGQPGVAFQGYLGPTRWVFRLNGFGGVSTDNGSQNGNAPTGGVTANTSVSF